MRKSAVLAFVAFAAAAVVAGLVSAAGPAGAAFPGANGKIAFDSNRDGNLEIYAMNADASGTPARLTDNPAFDGDPAWSPDGSRIAFASARDDNFEIYAMNADGAGTPARLTDNPAPDGDPAWSPDGSRIAFDSNRDGNLEIYAMNADGSGTPARLTDNPAEDRFPDWQPLPDSDGDGIPDASDPDTVAEIVDALDSGDFSAPGHETSIRSRLEDAEAQILAGNVEEAIRQLENLQRRVDGCVTAGVADSDDWILPCDEQQTVWQALDDLIAALSA